MSDIQDKLSGERGQDELSGSSDQCISITISNPNAVTTATVVNPGGVVSAGSSPVGGAMATASILQQPIYSGTDIDITDINIELEVDSEYSAELDEILSQLNDTDDRIVETRQNTVRLGIETRSMLDDLRKQLG